MGKLSFALSALAVMTGWVATAETSVVTGSFQSGNFRNWMLVNAQGLSVSQPRHRAADTADVVSSWGRPAGLSPVRHAMDGRSFAAFGSLADGYFVGNGSYDITLKQTLSPGLGDTVSGWFFFNNGDYQSQDCAWVKSFDRSGQEVANPWHEWSGGLIAGESNTTPYLSATPWTQWQWKTPADRLYTVTLGMSTCGDDNYASYGFFDDICMQASTSVVPEPSALALWVTGALLLAGRRAGFRLKNSPGLIFLVSPGAVRR